jgi:hypothetical protein
MRAYGGSKRFTVRQTIPEVGLAGYVPVRSSRLVSGTPAVDSLREVTLNNLGSTLMSRFGLPAEERRFTIVLAASGLYLAQALRMPIGTAGSTVSSQSSTDWRNEATITAIAAMSEKLATIAARLTAAWPGAPRNCETPKHKTPW